MTKYICRYNLLFDIKLFKFSAYLEFFLNFNKLSLTVGLNLFAEYVGCYFQELVTFL